MDEQRDIQPSTLNRQPSTVVVELTPPGRGAVAIVMVAGPDAVPVVERCCVAVSGRTLSESPLGSIVLSRWGGADGEELVVCRRTIDQVEVHCHGGVAAVGAVIERLIAEGCRETSWREWLQATAIDRIRAAAHVALADAPTARTAGILLDQYHGALSAAVRTAVAAIGAQDWRTAADVVETALAFRALGEHLTRSWQVVLAGAPNVGKSSLVNALAGYQRSIVSHVPGTTRDVVTTMTAIDGWPVQLADTAGLHAAADELEAAGMALADAAMSKADLVVVVHEATAPMSALAEIDAHFPLGTRLIYVRNKIDLLPTPHQCHSLADPAVVTTSAVNGVGVAELVAAIGRALVPNAPAAGSAVPFTIEQADMLAAAQSAIEARNAVAAEAALLAMLAI